MSTRSKNLNSVFYSDVYHPIQAGSIDGTDILPHDNAILRAQLCSSIGLCSYSNLHFPPFSLFFSQSSSSLVYFPKFNFADDPFGDPKATGDPYCTLFVGRLSRITTEDTLRKVTFLGLSIFISHVRISNRKIFLYGEYCLWFIILIQFNSVHVTKVMFELME